MTNKDNGNKLYKVRITRTYVTELLVSESGKAEADEFIRQRMNDDDVTELINGLCEENDPDTEILISAADKIEDRKNIPFIGNEDVWPDYNEYVLDSENGISGFGEDSESDGNDENDDENDDGNYDDEM